MATVVASTSGTTTAALPTGTAAGDWVVVFTYSSTATTPTLPAAWIGVVSNATSPAMRVQWRQYDGAWTMPTFTGAAHTSATAVRPAAGQELAVGTAPAIVSGNATQIVWAAMTLTDTSGASIVLRGGVHARPDVTLTVPAGHTLSPTSTGVQPGYITCRKTTTTDAASATTGGSTRNAANSRGQLEVRDVAPAVPVSTTRDASWDVTEQAAPAEAAAGWATYGETSVGRSSTWQVLTVSTPVEASRLSSWQVRQSQATGRSSTWHTRQQRAAGHASTWHARQQVAGGASSTWAAYTGVATGRAGSWASTSPLVTDRPTVWTLQATVLTGRPSTWLVDSDAPAAAAPALVEGATLLLTPPPAVAVSWAQPAAQAREVHPPPARASGHTSGRGVATAVLPLTARATESERR